MGGSHTAASGPGSDVPNGAGTSVSPSSHSRKVRPSFPTTGSAIRCPPALSAAISGRMSISSRMGQKPATRLGGRGKSRSGIWSISVLAAASRSAGERAARRAATSARIAVFRRTVSFGEERQGTGEASRGSAVGRRPRGRRCGGANLRAASREGPKAARIGRPGGTKIGGRTASAVGGIDPGKPTAVGGRRFVPAHGPGQGQLPLGSIRPRGYVSPVEPRSVA